MKINVTNLGNNITDDSLDAIFSTYGEVTFSQVIIDNRTGISSGTGSVEMPDSSEAFHAITKINGAVINGKSIEARESSISEL